MLVTLSKSLNDHNYKVTTLKKVVPQHVQLHIYLPDYFCWHSTNNRIRWNILIHHGSCRNNSVEGKEETIYFKIQ